MSVILTFSNKISSESLNYYNSFKKLVYVPPSITPPEKKNSDDIVIPVPPIVTDYCNTSSFYICLNASIEVVYKYDDANTEHTDEKNRIFECVTNDTSGNLLFTDGISKKLISANAFKDANNTFIVTVSQETITPGTWYNVNQEWVSTKIPSEFYVNPASEFFIAYTDELNTYKASWCMLEANSSIELNTQSKKTIIPIHLSKEDKYSINGITYIFPKSLKETAVEIDNNIDITNLSANPIKILVLETV